MTRKLFFSVLLILVLSIGFLLCQTAIAAQSDIIDSGSCGKNLTWTLDASGILTISGTGAMKNYEERPDVPWISYDSDITAVVIGNGVTSIGDRSFSRCERLTSVTIPDSVTSIGEYAFTNCGITNISIGSGVTTIDTNAFSRTHIYKIVNHSALDFAFGSDEYGEIAKNAKIIEDQNGTKTYLSDVWIETEDNFLFSLVNDEYTLHAYLGEDATVTLPKNMDGSKYSIYRFRGASNVIIPEGTTSIDEDAFRDCVCLISVILPDGVVSIQDHAFDGCDNLENIRIPESLRYFGTFAFFECGSLKDIYIPDGVTVIEYYMLSRCDALTSVRLPDSITHIGAYAFWESVNITTINIPDSVAYIGREAFKDCQRLRGDFVIPDGVTAIYDSTFCACYCLSSIIIPDSVTSIGKWAFSSCSITNITIPDSVTSIGEGAFKFCDNLTSIVIPSGVTQIEKNTFYKCSSLECITIPESVTSIAGWAFTDCGNLWHVLYTGTETQWNAIEGVNKWLLDATRHYNCTGDEVTDLANKVCTVCAANCKHEWEIAQITKEPTCYEDGEGVYECILCGDTKTGTVASSGHSFGRWTQITAPTCLDKGQERRECANCDEYEVRDVKATGHSYVKKATEATCTEDGYTTYTCRSCGDTYVDGQVAAQGHNWDDATCTVPKTCSTCYATEGSALGHSWDDGVTNEDTTVSYTCVACGEVKTEGNPVLPTDPTEPSTEPTDPTMPSIEPTEPSTNPNQQQTQPSEKPTQPVQTRPQGTGDTPSTQQEKNDPTILIVIIATVCLGGGAIALVLFKKVF